MVVDHPVTPVLYLLPKIHKHYISVPPGRPIVSAIGSITEKISAYIDHFLQPLVHALPSYVKDSMEFLKMLNAVTVSEDSFLVTMDIESLYTNVPFEEGLQATEFFLNKRRDCNPSSTCLLDLLDIVLTSNFFMFESDFYLQISGTSMGSKMAPSFASLYVGHFESETIFREARNPFFNYISNWKRYIDDIFFTWSGTEKQLKDFHHFMNTNNNNLTFTLEFDKYKMNFLDIMVCKDSTKLYSNLYRKSTDRNTILHGDSFHPIALKRSLPVSQFNRIRRICTKDTDYRTQAEDLSNRFQQRHYKTEWISAARCKFETVTQKQSLERTRAKKLEHRINCIIDYSPLGKDFEKIIKKHWYIVQTDSTLKDFSASTPRIVYKRPQNLRDMLVRADLPPSAPPHFLQDVPHGNFRCGHCTQCNFTHKTKTFSHPRTGKSFKINGTITCNTCNVIYMLKCPCGLCYIGKTTRPLKVRISEHRSSIRNHDPKSPVAVHFSTANHNVSSLRYLGIERVQSFRRGGDINAQLLKREAFWIYTLDTISPKGLNEAFDLRPFL